MAEAVCQLGPIRFRIAPQNINWNYQIDTAKYDTLGGQVVQVLGATLSDLTITGQFGQTRGRNNQQSWQLANAFQKQIKSLIDKQTLKAPKVTLGRGDKNKQAHAPIPFRYSDGVHDWAFDVLIKSIQDDDGQLTHATGKFSYSYRLTLFIVQVASENIREVAIDNFIKRLAAGVGWKISIYNGPVDPKEAQAFIAAHGGDVPGFLEKVLLGDNGTPISPAPPATSPGAGKNGSGSSGATGPVRKTRATTGPPSSNPKQPWAAGPDLPGVVPAFSPRFAYETDLYKWAVSGVRAANDLAFKLFTLAQMRQYNTDYQRAYPGGPYALDIPDNFGDPSNILTGGH